MTNPCEKTHGLQASIDVWLLKLINLSWSWRRCTGDTWLPGRAPPGHGSSDVRRWRRHRCLEALCRVSLSRRHSHISVQPPDLALFLASHFLPDLLKRACRNIQAL